LRAASANALGSTAAGTTIASGATLDIANVAIGAEALSVSGNGVSGNNAVSWSGNASLAGNVTLTGNTTMNGTGNMTFSGTVDGAATLNATSSTSLAFSNNIGAGIPLTGVTITAPSISVSNVTTNGAQQYNGNVTMASTYITNGNPFAINGNTTVNNDSSVAASGVQFTGTIQGNNDTPDFIETLTISSTTTTFGGAIGGATEDAGLINLNVTTASTNLTLPSTTVGTLAATTNGGDITQTSALSVSGTTNLQAGSGSIVLTNASNDFVGTVTAGGTGGIEIVDVNNLTLGIVNAGAGIVNLTAGADMTGLGTVPNVTGGTGIFSSSGGADSQVTNLGVTFSGSLTLTGSATLWNFTSGSTANPFQRTAETIGIQVAGGTILANIVQIQAGNVIGSVASAAAAVIVDEANKTFGTDSVAEDVEYGFAGEIGATPPMDHRIDQSGISLPRCVEEAREGAPCK
jgi:hypothetical protein